MQQFISGAPEAFSGLKDDATGACVRFCNEKMPPGAMPDHADIGFEVNPQTGAATLFVSYGVRYRGTDNSVRQWFENGQIEFPSFEDLSEWILDTLKDAYLNPESNHSNSSPANSLTDIAAIESNISEQNSPLYIDEDELFYELEKQVLGQAFALKTLASVISRHLARIKPSRPAVLLAVGPTGVGKTRSVEVLQKILTERKVTGKGYQFLRLDMSEYQEAHRISQLLGAPQGYVGHGEGSQLIDALRTNPNTIILFDEIEKAHHSILLAIMNAMDAGRISSPSGKANSREIDCKHAVFIFTSNLDAQAIIEELNNRSENGNRSVEDEVCRRRLKAAGLPLEIIGRIGRFLVYQPIGNKIRAGIVALSIREVAEEYGVTVSYIEPEVIIGLMQQNHSQEFGARPEKYLIDDLLGSAFAETARAKLDIPMRVCANPYRCIPEVLCKKDEVDNETD